MNGGVDPALEWSDSSTLARELSGPESEEARTPVRRAPDTEELRKSLDRFEQRSTPILENDVATPVIDSAFVGDDSPFVGDDAMTPIVDNDVTTLTDVGGGLEALPRQSKLLVVDENAADHSSATATAPLVRRNSIPPPALPDPPRTVPAPSAGHASHERRLTGTRPVIGARTGNIPWIAALPTIDRTPRTEPAIRTPLAMSIEAREDNLTRVAPLTAPPIVHQIVHQIAHPLVHPLVPQSLVPVPDPPSGILNGLTSLALQRIALTGAVVLLLALGAMVTVRPRMNGAAARPAAAATARTVETTMPPAPPIAQTTIPPTLTPSPTTLTPVTKGSATRPNVPATKASATSSSGVPPTRPGARRRHAPAPPAERPLGRGSSRPSIPVRREL